MRQTPTPPPAISAHDLMDSNEVADAFRVTRSTLHVAMSRPEVLPTLTEHLPAPLRKIGSTYVWLRADVEAAVTARADAKAARAAAKEAAK
jgi:predicted DNA-binding transcriptional regulator AlpA